MLGRMRGVPSLLRTYAAAIRDEPGLRAYLLGALADDVGIAVSTWAVQLLRTDLFTDQRERARLMMPTLLCFLLGCVIAGPLADWARHESLAALARWRWRLIVWGRVLETIALSIAVIGIARGGLTIGSVLPYFMVSSFMRTALRPTRTAFEVDLLREERVQIDADGKPLLDELGAPRIYKVHLLSFGAMTSLLRTTATFGGLLLGGRILAAVNQRYAPLFAFDIGTNLVFIGVVVWLCHPDRGTRAISLRELVRDPEADAAGTVHVRARASGRSLMRVGLAEFATSLREAWRFLRRPEQRPLFWFLFGAWMVEVIAEFYDGSMIVRHELAGSADDVRYAELGWSLAQLVVLALLPALARRVGSLGKLFLVTMFVDAFAILAGGQLAGRSASGVIVPFVLVLALDKGLTSTSSALAELAQNSASSAAIRGRIVAAWAFVVILSDIFAEGAATALSEALGLPGMLVAIGAFQLVAMILVAVLGGARLWNFGLRSTDRASLPPTDPVDPAVSVA
jgi:hypothetical protein